MNRFFSCLPSFVLFLFGASALPLQAQSAQVAQLDRALTGELSLAQPRWERVAIPEADVRALAVSGTQILVGGPSFVAAFALPDSRDPRRVSTLWSVQRGEARALCSARATAALAATSDGLYAVAPQEGSRVAQVVQVDLGSRVGEIVRLACDEGALAVATETGTYVSFENGAWRSLQGRLRFQGAESVQWQSSIGQHQNALGAQWSARLWILSQGELWWSAEVATHEMSEPARVESFERFASRTPVDLLATDEELFVLCTDGIAVAQGLGLPVESARENAVGAASQDASRISSNGNVNGQWEGTWEWVGLALAPGVRVERLFFASGVYWLATDQGLFWAHHPTQSWQRADAPLGFEPIYDLSADGDRVWVAAASGVWQSVALRPVAREPAAKSLDLESAQSSAPQRSAVWTTKDPDFAALRMAALAYLRLEREQLENLSERIAKRSVLPKFVLSTGRGGGTDFTRDYDETYSSGATHPLRDWERRRASDWDVNASFSWDFGDTVYHDEMIDVAADRRKALEFRDKVLDELAQLYFERQRVLLELAALADPASVEAVRLQIRAQELAAGIDAWTGGWFSRTH